MFFLLCHNTLKLSPTLWHHQLARLLRPRILHPKAIFNRTQLYGHPLPLGLLNDSSLNNIIRYEALMHLQSISIVIAYVLLKDYSRKVGVAPQRCVAYGEDAQSDEALFYLVDAAIDEVTFSRDQLLRR